LFPIPYFPVVKKEVIASAELPSSAMEDGGMNKSEGRSFLSEKLNLNLSHWRYPWNSSKVATMLLVDLDKLSQINQHFAHRVGNAVLYTVYQILRHSQADFSGRCGDDTFYAIFLQVPADRTEQLAEILCHDIGTYGWDNLAAGLSVTCSIGVAHYDKEEPPIDWPVRAAIGMRRAKEKGGNQVSPGPAMLPLADGSYRVSRNLADYFS
jgi:diguanylate cyclase (GGDEF)-like protein